MFIKRIMLIVVSFVLFIALCLYAFGAFLPKNSDYILTQDDKFLNIYGHKIRYKFISRNASETIVFLHSFGSKLEMWDSLSKYFYNQNLLAYDMIGFGKSDKPEISYSLNTQSNYLIKILNELKIDTTILIGSSMGASTAVWFASKYPERIKAIILFAPSGFPGSMQHSFPGNIFYKPGTFNSLGAFITSTTLFNLIFPNTLGLQTFTLTASYNQEYVNALKIIKQPTLLIWSTGDKRSLYSYAGKYLKYMHNSKLIEKPPEAGHNCPNYRPEETAEEIIFYLKSNDSISKINSY